MKIKKSDKNIFSKLNQKVKILNISDKNINRASQLTSKVNHLTFQLTDMM